MTINNFLFVPANNLYRINKALNSQADSIIIDLEDSIADSEKISVRNNLTNIKKTNKKIYVRINDLKSIFWESDIKALDNNIDGILIPKVNCSKEMINLENFLVSVNKTYLEVIPLLECAKGIKFAYEIGCSIPNITRLAFGSVDYSVDLGLVNSEEESALLYAKSKLINDSRAAGLLSPIDGPYIQTQNYNGFISNCTQAKKLGFKSKLLIHPNQIEPFNSVFKSPINDYTFEKKVVTQFEDALKRGIGVINIDGIMVDYPVYKNALKKLDLAVDSEE